MRYMRSFSLFNIYLYTEHTFNLVRCRMNFSIFFFSLTVDVNSRNRQKGKKKYFLKNFSVTGEYFVEIIQQKNKKH